MRAMGGMKEARVIKEGRAQKNETKKKQWRDLWRERERELNETRAQKRPHATNPNIFHSLTHSLTHSAHSLGSLTRLTHSLTLKKLSRFLE